MLNFGIKGSILFTITKTNSYPNLHIIFIINLLIYEILHLLKVSKIKTKLKIIEKDNDLSKFYKYKSLRYFRKFETSGRYMLLMSNNSSFCSSDGKMTSQKPTRTCIYQLSSRNKIPKHNYKQVFRLSR